MKEVRELIVSLSENGISIFLSSHLLHEVEQVCTSMAIINQGQLITAGKVDELLAKSDLFTAEIQATPLDKAQTVLASLKIVKNLVVTDDVLKVTVSSQHLSKVNEALVSNGVHVSALIPRSSLEDFFLSLTGSEGPEEM